MAAVCLSTRRPTASRGHFKQRDNNTRLQIHQRPDLGLTPAVTSFLLLLLLPFLLHAVVNAAAAVVVLGISDSARPPPDQRVCSYTHQSKSPPDAYPHSLRPAPIDWQLLSPAEMVRTARYFARARERAKPHTHTQHTHHAAVSRRTHTHTHTETTI